MNLFRVVIVAMVLLMGLLFIHGNLARPSGEVPFPEGPICRTVAEVITLAIAVEVANLAYERMGRHYELEEIKEIADTLLQKAIDNDRMEVKDCSKFFHDDD